MIYSNVILLPTKRVIKYRGSCTQFSSRLPLYLSLILVTRQVSADVCLVSGSVASRGVPRFGINGGFPYFENIK